MPTTLYLVKLSNGKFLDRLNKEVDDITKARVWKYKKSFQKELERVRKTDEAASSGTLVDGAFVVDV